MENYKKAYFELFNKLTDVIEELKELQCRAEELIVSDDTEQSQK